MTTSVHIRPSVTRFALALFVAALLVPVSAAFAAPEPERAPPVDVSKLTPEQRASFDKLSPELQAEVIKGPLLPATTGGTSTTPGSYEPFSSTTPENGNGTSMYILVGAAILAVIGLGSLLARRQSN